MMLRLCSKALVGMVKPHHLVKPLSATMVAGRNLTQQGGPPSLPVPPLQQTCEIYLSTLESILEVDELKRTKELVEEFQTAGGVGERLQRSLERKACNSDNWLTDDYVKREYLDRRKPLVIFSNPGVICPPDVFKRTDMKLTGFAAKCIARLLDIKTMIDNETLPVEYMGGKPMCMKQFEQVMSSCRIPGLKTDTLVFYGKSPNPPKHITVVHNSQFFALDVYNSDGTRLTVDQLNVQLERICNSSQQTNTEPVGILTTQHRNVWSKSYISLIKDKTNKESISAIQSSIFTLCLDGAMAQGPDDMNLRNGILQMMHGGGSQRNSGNRWFDKGMQVIIAEDGTCGGNCSHATADGTILLSILDDVVTNLEESQVVQPPLEPLPMPQKLHFNITPEIKKDIEEAKMHMDILAQNLDLRVKIFDHFGKNALKSHKMSPDAFIQMAIQLAYYRMHQQCCSTLEPASLRLFRRGRVTFIGSNTRVSANFVKAFDDPKKQNSEKVDLMVKAINAHRRYTIMGLSGQAMQGHLFGLKMQAIEEKIPMPEIFTDTSYAKAFDYQMVTTQVMSKTGCLPCLGPEEPDMYNLYYGIKNNHIDFIMTRYDASKTCRVNNNAARLLQAVEDALLDMRTLLQQTPTRAKLQS